MANGGELTDFERKKAQKAAMISQLFAIMVTMVVAGQYMMIYASDVLNLSPQKIAIIFSLAPFASALRLPIIPYIQRYGMVRTLVTARVAQVFVVMALIAVPAMFMSGPLLALLIVLFILCREVGLGTVWQPLMRHITTIEDRGSFFGGMRTGFTLVSLAFAALVSWFVGQSMEEFQFKIILGISILGTLNAIFWSRRIPEPAVDHEMKIPPFRRSLKHVWFLLRRSRLFRLPLIISLLISMGQLPISIVYFRDALHVPADILMFSQIFCATLGQALSLILWGKISDSLGFRPMLAGLLLLTSGLSLILWVVKPFSMEEMSLMEVIDQNAVSVAALMVFGFMSGLLHAGLGIATTSVMHYHVSSRDSMANLNLFSLFTIFFQSLVMLALGFFLQQVVMPRMELADTDSLFYFDWFKVYSAGLVPLLMIVAIPLVMRLPNLKPWFSIFDFFAALRHAPWKSVIGARGLYQEDEESRIVLARSLGSSKNPMNIEPLTELLRDPSYEVKVEAIRGLARTGSEFAAKELIQVLEDQQKRSFWGHTAWALGELRAKSAVGVLIERLGPENPVRARAMAARSLGKIGDLSAVDPLVETLRWEEKHLHVVASACWGLLKLNSYEHADYAFRGLLKLREREERYEMLSIFSRWLGVTDRWILISDSEASAFKSLSDYLDTMSDAWQAERGELIEAFRRRDRGYVATRLEERAALVGESKEEMVKSLRRVMVEADDWSPLCVLAVAYLLLGK